MIEAGELDRDVVIKQITESISDAGGTTNVESIYAEVPAKVESISTGQRLLSNVLHGTYTSKFTIRYLTGLNSKMKIYHDSKVWNILSIAVLGRDEGHVLLAEAID